MKPAPLAVFHRATPTAALRRRGAETHVRDFGDPETEVGQHNLRLLRELEARQRKIDRQITAQFCGRAAPRKPESQPSYTQRVRSLIQSDPARHWRHAELRQATGLGVASMARALGNLKQTGEAYQVSYGVWSGRPPSKPFTPYRRARLSRIGEAVRAYLGERQGQILRTGDVAKALGISCCGASHWLHRLADSVAFGEWAVRPTAQVS
jgi:hypothetical protein